jgi:HD-like signal output (HDOD) protein
MMEADRVFDYIENSVNFPNITHNISEIFDMLKNPDGLDFEHLVQEVSRHDQLCDLLLRVYNAKHYRPGKSPAAVKDAVIYLGTDAVQNLLVFYLSKNIFSEVISLNKGRNFKMVHYWRHVLGTSAASYILSMRINKMDKHKLFTYGLIHDIGLALLDICLPDLLDEIFVKLMKGVHQIVAERSVLGGLTHADIGAWLCRKWNLRDDITNIVEFHHTPFVANSTPDEVKLIYVADVISTEYFEKLLGLNMYHAISSKIMDSYGITNEDVKAVAAALPGEVDRLSSIFTWT